MATPSDADPILRDDLKQRASALKLYGLLAHWDETPKAELPWVRSLIAWEEVERRRRGLERRLGAVRQGCRARFMTLGFIQQTANIILVGPKSGSQPSIR